MAGLGSIGEFFSGLMENETIKQIVIWGIMNQAITGTMAPEFQLITNMMNELQPYVPLSPSQLADAVVRGYVKQEDAQSEAAKSGIDAARFLTMVYLAGSPLAPQELATALRRGLIPEDTADPNGVSFNQGIAEGDLADKWAPIIKELATQIPTPTDALDALLQGQVSKEEGMALYKTFGGDPQYFQLLFDTRGSAPTPLEATQMAMRDIIPWKGTGPDVVSFQQAFLEGPWRDKWMEPYQALSTYIPTGSQVKTMLTHAAITHAQALKYLSQRGITGETAQAFLTEASNTKTTASKELAESIVNKLYYDQIIDRAKAQSMLELLKYTPAEADFILEVQDLSRYEKALSSAFSKIRGLYVGHKIDTQSALNALHTLEIPDNQINAIMQVWELEAQVNIKQLTEAQIADAFYDTIITQAEAMQELEAIGYQPHDAWFVLCVKMKEKLPDEPPTNVAMPRPGHLTGVSGD